MFEQYLTLRNYSGIDCSTISQRIGYECEGTRSICISAVAATMSVTIVSTLPELLTTALFLSIHTPHIASTRGLIAEAELSQLKPGARVLDVARGGKFDEDALLAALESNHLAGAAVDGFTSEPPHPDSSAARLVVHPRTVVTPHLGVSTVEAQERFQLMYASKYLTFCKDCCRAALSMHPSSCLRSTRSYSHSYAWLRR